MYGLICKEKEIFNLRKKFIFKESLKKEIDIRFQFKTRYRHKDLHEYNKNKFLDVDMIKTSQLKQKGTYGALYSAQVSKSDKTEIAVKRNIIDREVSFVEVLENSIYLRKLEVTHFA